ncbi:hypothetical protein Q5H92_01285 [Hymenobacter sp. M29]|uniref:TonB C-terminal domain-containing protein n=1 Tax=Hymenobacter mellowenesis TaxID=3063995 RepID=A0ABT9A565_9BACT|nr:hypothetical protein [Hymenobacter sp. M29]MDO7844974.1 hypothetical protein [Hymenobacter sp. M29]
MTHRYFRFLPGLLILQLAACSTDQPSERSAARHQSTPKPAVTAADAVAATSASAGTGAVPGPAAAPAAEMPVAVGRQMVGPPASPSRKTPRPLAYHSAKLPKARPTTFANAVVDTAADELEGIDALGLPAPSLPDGLNSFLLSGLPPVQEFTVRPGRDTLLIGRQGTQLHVPADAWDVPALSGPVRVQLREFYSIADMVLAGLGTTANRDLLETGGMLHVAATSETGKPVALRQGQRLGLRMPTPAIKPDMRLFRGETVGRRSPNWVLDSLAHDATAASSRHASATRRRRREKYDRSRRIPKDQWPVYSLGSKRLNRAILEGTRYQTSTVARLRRGRAQSDEERAAVKSYNRKARSSGAGKLRRYAAVEFVVDTTGRVLSPKVRPGCDADLAAPVLAVVAKLQAWKPARYAQWEPGKNGRGGQLRWKLKPAMGLVEVGITPAGTILVSPTWDANATMGLLMTQQAARQRAIYLAKVEAQVARRDSILRSGGQLSATDLAGPTAESLFYEFGSAGLGWVNCDRFVESRQPLVRFAVKAPVRNAQVMLVFREMRCMVAGAAGPGAASILFDKLPSGANVTIVAIRWEEGKALLATLPTTVSARPYVAALDYRPVTMVELQQALARL